MSSIDIIFMGLKNLFRRKTRTFLTVLGVIIGTASIVVMLSLGIGMDESFKKEIDRMGSVNIIDVYKSFDFYDDDRGSKKNQPKALDEQAIAEISNIEGVEAVMPIYEQYIRLVSGKYSAGVQILGVNPKIMEAFDFKIGEGRLLEPDDKYELVFGSEVPMRFRNARSRRGYSMRYMGDGEGKPEPKVDVLNDNMILTFDMSYGRSRPGRNASRPKYKKYKVTGVGILEAGDYDEKSYCAFMNIEQLKKLVQDNERREHSGESGRSREREEKGYERVKVKVKNIDDVEKIQEQIKEMGFEAHSLSDISKSMKKTSGTIQTVLGAIGAVSLLVAAIGITNTMIMSIYERTREIGVMKVLGCALRNIKQLFLFEAGLIGFFGGVFGVGLSYLMSFLLNRYGDKFSLMMMGPMDGETAISIIPVWLIGVAIAFATIIGLVSGFYPARRAMKLSALEAIKTE